ncbi:hypothetical protein ACWDYJ_07375 [Streptomyces sp. NPDC003042]
MSDFDKAADVAGTAQKEMGHVKDEAATRARDLAGELRGQFQDQAQSQTRHLAQNVRRLADEVREMSEGASPDSTAAGVARKIADSGRQIADQLESRGPDGLMSELQDFARRRPGVFLAGAALAGFAVARAGKGVSAAGSAAAPAGSDGRAAGAEGDGRSRYEAPYADPLDTYGQSSQPPRYTPSYDAASDAATE